MRSVNEILKDVDLINWSALHHAYGEAGDIPGLLRGLVSEDKDTRSESLHGLCGTIWHQGTVYEASPHAVPLLLEMLRAPEVPEKAGIALLLAEMADATASLERFAKPEDEISRSFRAYLKQEGRDLDEELANERVYLEATRNAVGLGIDSLIAYLRHEEPAVREGVARALANYPERAREFLTLLEDARESETEYEVRAAIETSIDELRQTTHNE